MATNKSTSKTPDEKAKKPAAGMKYYRTVTHGLRVLLKDAPDGRNSNRAEFFRFVAYRKKINDEKVTLGFAKSANKKVQAALAEQPTVVEITQSEFEKQTKNAHRDPVVP